MDVLDAAIVLLVALTAWMGYRRGISWVAPILVSLLIGFIAGALLAPPVARAVSKGQAQPTILLTVFLATVLLCEGIGTAIGYRFRMRTIRSRYSRWDSGIGAVVAALGVLVSAWFLGITFSQSPLTGLDYQIRHSAIVRGLDAVVPRPPAPVLALEQLLSGSDFPNPLLGLTGPTVPDLPIPSTSATPAVNHVADEVVKVLSTSSACGTLDAGSGWPVAPHYIVTNAHVVAASDSVSVLVPGGPTLGGQVVYFDPEVDVAIIYVPALNLQPLPRVAADPASGTLGFVIGYPGGGQEQVVPAAVRGTEHAEGDDIYSANYVVRDIEVLSAVVIPGNSGGPIVNDQGQVIGLVFAASTDPSAHIGYALTMSQINADLTAGIGRTTAVATTYQGNVCAQ